MTNTPTTPPPQPPVFTEQAAQHASIEALLSSIVLANGGPALGVHMAQLKIVLVDHFQHEEAPNGVFDGVLERDRTLVGELDALCVQHREIAELVDCVIDLIPADPVAALAMAHSLAGKLSDHEQRENELVMQALYLDCGEND